MGGKALAAVEEERGSPLTVARGSDGHGWVCRGHLVPTGRSLARRPSRGHTGMRVPMDVFLPVASRSSTHRVRSSCGSCLGLSSAGPILLTFE